MSYFFMESDSLDEKLRDNRVMSISLNATIKGVLDVAEVFA